MHSVRKILQIQNIKDTLPPSTELPVVGIQVRIGFQRDHAGKDLRSNLDLAGTLNGSSIQDSLIVLSRDFIPITNGSFFDLDSYRTVQATCESGCISLQLGVCAAGEQSVGAGTDLKCEACPDNYYKKDSNLDLCTRCLSNTKSDKSRTNCRNVTLTSATAKSASQVISGVVAAVVATHVAVAIASAVGSSTVTSIGGATGGSTVGGGGAAASGGVSALIVQVQFLNLIGKVGGSKNSVEKLFVLKGNRPAQLVGTGL